MTKETVVGCDDGDGDLVDNIFIWTLDSGHVVSIESCDFLSLSRRISSILIGRAPTLLRSHWSRASEC